MSASRRTSADWSNWLKETSRSSAKSHAKSGTSQSHVTAQAGYYAAAGEQLCRSGPGGPGGQVNRHQQRVLATMTACISTSAAQVREHDCLPGASICETTPEALHPVLYSLGKITPCKSVLGTHDTQGGTEEAVFASAEEEKATVRSYSHLQISKGVL